MMSRPEHVANLLGSPRAEADSLLDRAFVETSDYRALTARVDFNFVVGRRGSGKSALYQKVGEYFKSQEDVLLFQHTPPEHSAMEFHRLLSLCETYRVMRAIARLTWRGYLLAQITDSILPLWEAREILPHPFLDSFRKKNIQLFEAAGEFNYHVDVLKRYVKNFDTPQEIPSILATALRIEEFQRQVAGALRHLGLHAVVLFDGLDEGWEPTLVSAAALGGLAIALSDFADAKVPIHGMVFVRDNMMRSLAHFDSDFSRHIEGNMLRLHWDEASLLHLVSNRLRIAYGENIGTDIKVWNRFAIRDLQDKPGFRQCLDRTLYRPRDVLVLLNRALGVAIRQGRSEITLSDIDAASKEISTERLSDLLKEYDVVLPGLNLFVDIFLDRPSITRFGSLARLLEEAVEESRNSDLTKARDFAILGSAGEIIGALYAVGFLGVWSETEGRFIFFYDGSSTPTDEWNSDREVIVHPCYWHALKISQGRVPVSLATSVSDEYELVPASEVQDIRVRGIGAILGELSNVPEGRDGASEFEKWVLRVVQILFQGSLHNFESKPNPGSVSQRDIVATNTGASGFWQRVLQDYESRQIIFEAKNYSEITNDDLRQVLSYSVNAYGRFSIIVLRSDAEGVTETVRSWLRAIYHEHHRAILFLPTVVLQRSLKKLRNVRVGDYTEKVMTKRLDTFERHYVSMPSGRRK